MSLEQSLSRIKEKLLSSKKEKLLCLSTTANVNNPAIYFGSFRETEATLAGNIIVRELLDVEKVIEMFDGLVEYFLIDSEVKNEVPNLEAYAMSRIKKSKYLIYKPNDFTVSALDMLIASVRGSIRGQTVYIVGMGNIGAKAALCLVERGAVVYGYERNQKKLAAIINGLNAFKRSNTEIASVSELHGLEESIDILIGATPGTPVIDEKLIQKVKPNGMIIDVGNGTLTREGIEKAKAQGLLVYSLSSFGGYTGMIENWLFQRAFLQKPLKKEYKELSLIVPGILGARGQVLVDDVENPTRVIGICDGKGELFTKDEALAHFEMLDKKFINSQLIATLKQLYF